MEDAKVERCDPGRTVGKAGPAEMVTRPGNGASGSLQTRTVFRVVPGRETPHEARASPGNGCGGSLRMSEDCGGVPGDLAGIGVENHPRIGWQWVDTGDD